MAYITKYRCEDNETRRQLKNVLEVTMPNATITIPKEDCCLTVAYDSNCKTNLVIAMYVCIKNGRLVFSTDNSAIDNSAGQPKYETSQPKSKTSQPKSKTSSSTKRGLTIAYVKPGQQMEFKTLTQSQNLKNILPYVDLEFIRANGNLYIVCDEMGRYAGHETSLIFNNITLVGDLAFANITASGLRPLTKTQISWLQRHIVFNGKFSVTQ